MSTMTKGSLVSDLDNKSGTCPCGNETKLRYVSEVGRVKDKLITVRNVPILYCADCEDGYMTGPDSLRYADRLREAFELGLDEIEF